MATDEYNAMLERLRDAADLINSFESESVQLRVVDALIQALGDASAEPARAPSDVDGDSGRSSQRPARTRRKRAKAAGDGSEGSARKRPAKTGFTLVNTLDLAPSGKESFEEFVAALAPNSHPEKCLAATYYFEHVTETKPVTDDMIFTAYRVANWTLPADLSNKISQAGSAGWIDPKDREDIKVTLPGLNMVEKTMRSRKK